MTKIGNEKVSQLLCNALCSADKKVLKARFRPNKDYTIRELPSSLVLLLRKITWIPQNNGKFVIPMKALKEELPKGFPYDEGYLGLKEIGFGDEARKQSEDYKQKLINAK